MGKAHTTSFQNQNRSFKPEELSAEVLKSLKEDVIRSNNGELPLSLPLSRYPLHSIFPKQKRPVELPSWPESLTVRFYRNPLPLPLHMVFRATGTMSSGSCTTLEAGRSMLRSCMFAMAQFKL